MLKQEDSCQTEHTKELHPKQEKKSSIPKLGLSRIEAYGMNGPINPQRCQVDPSYCKFGSETILNLLNIFENQIDGVIENKDSEYVHKTRVASRRLRAALPVFKSCFPIKEYKKWKCEIKKVTSLLADSRDLDVQIAFIQQYIEKLSSLTDKGSLDILLQNHKNRRNNIQPNLVNGMQKLKASYTLEDIIASCRQSIATVKFNV